MMMNAHTIATTTTLRRALRLTALCAGLLLATALPARAASISYNVLVDTSTIAGTQGFLDLQFLAGGLDALPALAEIAGFAAFDTTFAPTADLTGDAAGLLPGGATLGNGQAFNDLFQGVTFGQQFSFVLTLSGAALSPGAPPLSGSAFSLLLFGADGFTPLLSSDPDGRLVSFQIAQNGQVGVETFGPADVNVVPEPATMWLVGTGIVALVARRRRTQRQS